MLVGGSRGKSDPSKIGRGIGWTQHGRQGRACFGISTFALFATVTTDASPAARSIRCAILSTGPGGMIPMLNIQLGEVVFGGVGAGLYGMLVFVVIAVFIAGLMVGRTPEYLGKKIGAYEVKVAFLSMLILALSILGFTAWASVTPKWGLAGLNNPGPHGFSEILYASLPSCTGNNGSASRRGSRPTANCGHRHHARYFRVARSISDDRARSWRLGARWRSRKSSCKARENTFMCPASAAQSFRFLHGPAGGLS